MNGNLKTVELAILLDVHEGTLRNWRTQGKGPRFIKRRARVEYPVDEVRRWQKEQKFQLRKSTRQ